MRLPFDSMAMLILAIKFVWRQLGVSHFGALTSVGALFILNYFLGGLFMKKVVALIMCIILFGIFGVVGGCSKNPKDPFVGSVAELVENQAHEEKAGYQFCGYFEDEDYSNRVYQAFDDIPNDYYAKYILDRSKLMEVDYTLKHPKMELEQVIYATDYMDAIYKYMHCTYFEQRIVDTNMHYSDMLGEEYKEIEVVHYGCTDKDKFYDFHDKTEYEVRYDVGNGIARRTFTRDTKWRAYIGEEKTTSDGMGYYIVDNSYAVIVNMPKSKRLESLTLPSTIEGKQVKVVSIYSEKYSFDGSEDFGEFNIGTLNIPSSVENVMIYVSRVAVNSKIEKIVFENGVKTIQLALSMDEELDIPSSTYFIDIRNALTTMRGQTDSMLYLKNQTINLNENKHYIAKNGLLYTAEGTLVYQYGNREKLNLHIEEGTKRVNRRSINGVAKNIYIPQSVEEFDLFFNEMSARYQTATYSYGLIDKPIFFVEGKTLTEKLLDLLINNSKLLGTYGTNFMLNNLVNVCELFVFGENSEWESVFRKEMLETSFIETVDESNVDMLMQYIIAGSKFKVENEKVYVKKFDIATAEYCDDWVLSSYLTEDFLKDDLSFDPVLARYYEYINNN